MPDFDLLYPARFLHAADFGGREYTLKISSVVQEDLEGDKGKQAKVVISFAGKKKQFVANKTNGAHLMVMFGRKSEDWIGKRVTMYPTEIPDPFWKAKDHPPGTPRPNIPCIRIRGSPDLGARITTQVQVGRKKIDVTVVPTGRPAPAGVNGNGAPKMPATPPAPAPTTAAPALGSAPPVASQAVDPRTLPITHPDAEPPDQQEEDAPF